MRLIVVKSEDRLAILYLQLYYALGWEDGIKIPVSDQYVGSRLDYGYNEIMSMASELPDSVYGDPDEWRNQYQNGVSNAVLFKSSKADIPGSRKLTGKNIRKPIKSSKTLLKMIRKLEN